MIRADDFLEPARAAGFDFYTGVPCSFLTPTINRVISGTQYGYVAAASEGESVAIAAGAWLAGHETVVMFQNSGLGNAVNPLTSLNFPFQIPTLLIVTWRGGPGLSDEPQHELMGEITPDLLSIMRIPHHDFPTSAADIGPVIEEARHSMASHGLPVGLIMQKDTISPKDLSGAAPAVITIGDEVNHCTLGPRPSRYATLERLLAMAPDTAAIIATTGKTGRELFTINDREQHLYQVGSMGCAAGIGLGVALHRTDPVIAIDGDGAALMKLGSLATVGSYRPENFVHLVLDNGTYDSTGGQPAAASGVAFSKVAAACGYKIGATCDDLVGFDAALSTALNSPGPHMIHMRIEPGSMSNLGRPTIGPVEVAARFKSFLASAST